MQSDDENKRKRKKRHDAGTILFTMRDHLVLTWLGQQYGMRLDHLREALGTYPGRGAKEGNIISEGAARDVVKRWEQAGWVKSQRIRAYEPFWIWPTRRGLQKVGLPYSYRNLAATSLDDLAHLYAINEIRLRTHNEEENGWVSERQLLQGVTKVQGQQLLHRPDAELRLEDGELAAIEAEFSFKKPFELAENLMELIRGQVYLQLKQTYGWKAARRMSKGQHSVYDKVFYYAPAPVRKHVRRQRARLVKHGDLTSDEAERIEIQWYPITQTEDEFAQEDDEDDLEKSLERYNSDEDEDED